MAPARTALLLAASLGLALVAAEGLLRLAPSLLPRGIYGAVDVAPRSGLLVWRTPVLYRGTRIVRRTPNADGFLDVAHAAEKPAGTLRVGLFGDSFVEALQVPWRETFVARLPPRLAGRAVEPFAIGISGRGTLHSFLEHGPMSERYALDVVGHFFYGNDLGDNVYEIARAHRSRLSPQPFAELTETGFELHWLKHPENAPWYYGVAKVLQMRTYLGRLVWTRLALLRRSLARARAEHPGDASAPRVPNPNELPARWPPPRAEEARRLAERILERWVEAAQRRGQRFFVFYVPRGDPQLRGSLADEETWLPWLRARAAALGVPLVEPTAALAARLAAGDAVYGDHWTSAGHEVVARELATFLEAEVAKSPPPAPGRPHEP